MSCNPGSSTLFTIPLYNMLMLKSFGDRQLDNRPPAVPSLLSQMVCGASFPSIPSENPFGIGR